MRQHIRVFLPGALVVLLAVAMACGAPSAPAENSPAPAATQSQAVPAATAVPQQPSQASAASEQPTAPPAAAVADPEVDRPTLNVGVIWLSTALDPVVSGWVASQSGMSENLFRLSANDLSPEPWLATGATQLDPLTWEIGIRSGVVFHNGKVLDAQVVKESLERTVRLSEGSADALAIDSVTVKDTQTVTVTTTEPRPTLPGLLTAPATAITDAAAADAAGEGNFIDAGALTGPYMPTHYVIEERLETVAYDDYWGGKPPLAGINHVAIPDTNSRELALQAGDVDVVINLSPEGVQLIESQPDLRVKTAGIGTSVVMWWVNFEREALSDPLVRQAVAHAIDRESIAGLIAPAGTGSFADTLLPKDLVSCPGVTGPVFDPDLSRALLSQAGYADADGDGIVEKDGQPLEIVIGGYPQRFQLPIMAETAQAMLADVGIRVDVQITEWSAVKEPVWDLFGWYNNVVDAGDPVLNVSKFVGLEADAESSAANNFGHYDNTGVAGVVAHAGETSDLADRKRIACDAMAVVTEEIALLPVAHAYFVYGVSERVTNFDPHPAHLYYMDNRISLTE
ncbi:MAG: ABC transporter substrate-binding protein [Chloroflexota bacterium]|nr:ABC transporter substrate-binding protein [Chloroflexota bacterium]MDE2683584.1 ABC transporter substrate-binding protein [Chloroflexota bacterium]